MLYVYIAVIRSNTETILPVAVDHAVNNKIYTSERPKSVKQKPWHPTTWQPFTPQKTRKSAALTQIVPNAALKPKPPPPSPPSRPATTSKKTSRSCGRRRRISSKTKHAATSNHPHPHRPPPHPPPLPRPLGLENDAIMLARLVVPLTVAVPPAPATPPGLLAEIGSCTLSGRRGGWETLTSVLSPARFDMCAKSCQPGMGWARGRGDASFFFFFFLSHAIFVVTLACTAIYLYNSSCGRAYKVSLVYRGGVLMSSTVAIE